MQGKGRQGPGQGNEHGSEYIEAGDEHELILGDFAFFHPRRLLFVPVIFAVSAAAASRNAGAASADMWACAPQ
ncbi:hypothetical protein D3C75_1026380 [compost metagenome]